MLIINIITHVPIWVWLILIFVILRGIKAMKTQVVPMKKLIIMPVLMIYISIDNVHYYQYYAIGAVLGVIIGYFLYRRLSMKIDRHNKVIEIAGSPQTLIVVLATFIAKFGIGVYTGMNPSAELGSIGMIITVIIGFFGGIYIGRLIVLYINYVKSPSERLM